MHVEPRKGALPGAVAGSGEAGEVSDQVRGLLRTSLPTRAVSLGQASELLHRNRRTLARQLEAEGTSFRGISNEVHFDLARRLLAGTAMSITDVGLALNYSEASAFTRAFRHWSGLSPRAWRERNRGGEPPDAKVAS